MNIFKNFIQNLGTSGEDLDLINVERSDASTFFYQIVCYDDENLLERQIERNLVQNFIEMMKNDFDCIIVGEFVEKRITEGNRKNIVKEINITNEKFIKQNMKWQKKGYNPTGIFILKDFILEPDIFEMDVGNFSNLSFWKKEEFQESFLNDDKRYSHKSCLGELFVIEYNSIAIIISNELPEAIEYFINSLKKNGHSVVFKDKTKPKKNK